jgi:hypothetical protein
MDISGQKLTYYQRNKERMKEYARRYHHENKDRLNEYHRRYFQECVKGRRQAQRAAARANRKKVIRPRKKHEKTNIPSLVIIGQQLENPPPPPPPAEPSYTVHLRPGITITW